MIELDKYAEAYKRGYEEAAKTYSKIFFPSKEYAKTILGQIREDIEILDGIRAEEVGKADVLGIIDRFIGYMEGGEE